MRIAFLFRVPALLLLSPLLDGCSSSESAGPLAFGELYQGYEDTSGGTTPASNHYMKFVDEGTVLNTYSDQPPEQVRVWFERGEPNVNSEDYELYGNVVTIVYGLASTYRGSIQGERILFDVTLLEGGTYKRNFVLLR
jgi:hypothetical protein